jgi:hypothetical protein
MVLAVVCMLVFLVGALVLFNTGMAVNKKIQLNNAADAAAYSAAVQEARTYNLIAYLNRAQVANEVCIAQMVSWHSWMNFAISGTDHFADAANDIGIALDITGVGAEVGVALNEMAAELKEAKQAMVTARNGMKTGFSFGIGLLSAANVAYSDAARFAADAQIGDIPKVVDTVIKQNTSNAQGETNEKPAGLNAKSLVLLESQLATANTKFIKLYQVPKSASASSNPSHTADADRLVNVIMQSRDGFSRERNGDLLGLHKRGGTDLISYNRWAAMDTLQVKIKPFLVTLIDLPLAWGGAAAVKNQNGASFSNLIDQDRGWTSPYRYDAKHDDRFNGARDNSDAGNLGRLHPADPNNNDAILTNYQGLHSYEDTAAKMAIQPYASSNPEDETQALAVGPYFTVAVEQKMSDVRTADNIQGMGGTPDVVAHDKTQNNKMTALASAQVYFDRPATLFLRNTDNDRELGNLFSPYWQARLIDTPNATKLEIFAADAVGL